MNLPEFAKEPKPTLSAKARESVILQARAIHFDLIIIGGGATGAGIALDAAVRGLKTLLVEKADFAGGTSSKSTKLIHGGLRYLKQLEIQLVREVGKERAIVHKNAAHLVHPEELILPIIENGSLGKYTTPVGLWMYEKLAGVKKSERFIALTSEETIKEEELLNPKIVKGGAIYREYRTDDARLVISLLKTAAANGAITLNYIRSTEFKYDNGIISGINVVDELNGQKIEFDASIIVNAAGPWCDEVRRQDSEVKGKKLQLTKGVHIVFERNRFPIKRTVYFDAPNDGRMVFAVPRNNTVYLGTTDTLYSENKENPRTSKEDTQYLLAAANFMFPSLTLTEKDIISSWAGLRPLIHEEGKSPSELSRKDEVFHTDSGLISIAGGKLTGYRKMAERTTDMVMTRLAASGLIEYKDCSTDKVKLAGAKFKSYKAVKEYRDKLIGLGRQVDLSEDDATYLVGRYGKEAGVILDLTYELHLEERDPALRLLLAELVYVVHFESVHTLSDFMIRRSGRLYFFRPEIKAYYKKAAEMLKELLGLSDKEAKDQLEEFEIAYEEALTFD